ncbi:MAG: septal ring lytic transglycosylase RlpA family protein [Acidobacteriota bacterium]|nr:septal ring lytic transglycosylase RlpA family protein [Acidobacteriota bacterium]
MRRVLTHSVYALLLLGGSMGAAPGHTTTTPVKNLPVFLPLPEQKPTVAELPNGKPYQVGKASWYGEFFQGKATASGEDFNMNDYTAAHRQLPLGTFVKVTNLKNHKAVIVRINDRGPVTPGRIIDLSYKAARQLDFHQNGLQKVQIDVLPPKDAEMAMARQPKALP